MEDPAIRNLDPELPADKEKGFRPSGCSHITSAALDESNLFIAFLTDQAGRLESDFIAVTAGSAEFVAFPVDQHQGQLEIQAFQITDVFFTGSSDDGPRVIVLDQLRTGFRDPVVDVGTDQQFAVFPFFF